MLVVRILDVTNYDAGCCNQDKLLQAGVQVDGVNYFSGVADTVIKLNLLSA